MKLLHRVWFWSGYPGCTVHEIGHLFFIGLFWFLSKSVRKTKVAMLKINKNMFVMGLSIEDEPIFVSDCVIRCIIAMAPLMLMIGTWYLAYIHVPHTTNVFVWICYILTIRGSLLCWPSDPDWAVAKYCIFRIWYTFRGEDQTYSKIANVIAKDKYGHEFSDIKPKKGKGIIKIKTKK